MTLLQPFLCCVAQEKVFVSFGGPTPTYHRLVHRICEQAMDLGFFTQILECTEADLQQDEAFWSQHGEFITTHPRGYGYWMWKPYLIYRVLEQLQDDDILIYADAGCLINPEGLQRLLEYIEVLKGSPYGILTYQVNFLEKQYSKQLLTQFLQASERDLDSRQMSAAVIIIQKNPHSTALIKEWSALGSIHHLIDDSETDEFVDHRHDQSIYSLLVKKYGAMIIGDNMFDRFSEGWKWAPFQGTQSKALEPDTVAHNVSPYIDQAVEELVASYVAGEQYKEKTPLCSIMATRGSDKSNYHNYTTLYSLLFDRHKQEKLNIFEMGLGTPYTDVPSNMGPRGSAGASLRGWADYFQRAHIYGADIDSRILFQQDKISTFYCDQRSPSDISQMFHSMQDPFFDIIIDDGLHEFDANVTFLQQAACRLKEGGIYIVEDLQPATLRGFAEWLPQLQKIFRSAILLKIPTEDPIVGGPYGDNALLILHK